PLGLECLETREAPSVTPLTQSFDTTPVGRLPAGWAQWSRTGQAAFAVSGQKAETLPQSLRVNGQSYVDARAWSTVSQPADVEVDAALYADNTTPIQLFARGSGLNTTRPTYYALQVVRGLEVKLLRVKGGVTTTLAYLPTANAFNPRWVRLALSVSGT